MKQLSDTDIQAIRSSWKLDGDTLVWARNTNRGKNVGDPVGISERKSGHQNVYLAINKKPRGFVLARIVWFLRTGEYPEKEIEHIDCNPKNNSASNLRLATRSQNMANTRRGRTGNEKKGVYQDKKTGKYYVQVQCNNEVYGKYGFNDFDTAYVHRQQLAKELFGEFAR